MERSPEMKKCDDADSEDTKPTGRSVTEVQFFPAVSMGFPYSEHAQTQPHPEPGGSQTYQVGKSVVPMSTKRTECLKLPGYNQCELATTTANDQFEGQLLDPRRSAENPPQPPKGETTGPQSRKLGDEEDRFQNLQSQLHMLKEKNARLFDENHLLKQQSQLLTLKEENARLVEENHLLKRQSHLLLERHTSLLEQMPLQVGQIISTALQKLQSSTKQHSDTQRRAVGNKLPDSEFRSKWKQLKFNIKTLSGHLEDTNPRNFLPYRLVDSIMGTFKHNQGRPRNQKVNQDPSTKRQCFEAYLWYFLTTVIFRSHSGTDPDRVRYYFKEFRQKLAHRCIEDESQIGPIYKWLQSGWTVMQPENSDEINMILGKCCDDIYRMIHGRDGSERSQGEVGLHNELRDILTLALELDAMIMTSQAMISVAWPIEVPQLNAGKYTRYQEAYMDAVEGEEIPTGDLRLRLCVTPMLLKRGNARGGNLDSQIVLARADVVVTGKLDRGSPLDRYKSETAMEVS